MSLSHSIHHKVIFIRIDQPDFTSSNPEEAKESIPAKRMSSEESAANTHTHTRVESLMDERLVRDRAFDVANPERSPGKCTYSPFVCLAVCICVCVCVGVSACMFDRTDGIMIRGSSPMSVCEVDLEVLGLLMKDTDSHTIIRHNAVDSPDQPRSS